MHAILVMELVHTIGGFETNSGIVAFHVLYVFLDQLVRVVYIDDA